MASTESLVQTIAGPPLLGVWIHDPDDPAGTLQQFLYAPSGRQEGREIASEMLTFAGRTRPIAEFGEIETDTLDVTLVIPHDDQWQTTVDRVRTLYRTFDVYCYRDSRGRAWYGVLRKLSVEDAPYGSVVTFQFERTYFNALPASLSVTSQAQTGN